MSAVNTKQKKGSTNDHGITDSTACEACLQVFVALPGNNCEVAGHGLQEPHKPCCQVAVRCRHALAHAACVYCERANVNLQIDTGAVQSCCRALGGTAQQQMPTQSAATFVIAITNIQIATCLASDNRHVPRASRE